MKKCWLLIPLAGAVGLASAGEITFASYNTHHSAGDDKVINPDRIAGVLDNLDADVIALQEIDMTNGRSYFSDQARTIAYHLSQKENAPWQVLYAPAIDFEQGKYGNAILFRSDKVRLKSFKTLELPGAEDGDGKRAAGIAQFSKLDDDTLFQFVSTHFTHKNKLVDGTTLQVKTYEVLKNALTPDLPTFIAADYNASAKPEGRNPKTFERIRADGWRIDTPYEGQSIDDEPWVIDYIISKNADHFKVAQAAVVENEAVAVASDHYPVKVAYTIEK